MIIQSKKVWIADQFVPAAIEVKDGKIVGTATVPMSMTPTMQTRKVCVTGQSISFRRA